MASGGENGTKTTSKWDKCLNGFVGFGFFFQSLCKTGVYGHVTDIRLKRIRCLFSAVSTLTRFLLGAQAASLQSSVPSAQLEKVLC